MKSTIKLLGSTAAGWLLAAGPALAAPCGAAGLPACDVPEPSSLPLLLLGGVAAAIVARAFKKKK